MKKLAKFKYLILGTLIIITIIITTIIYQYLHSSTIIIQVAPINASISIDGEKYQNGIFKTSPKDQVEIVISAEGFETKTFNTPIEKGKLTKILTYLVPEDNNWEYYEKTANQESLSILLTNSGYQSWDLIKISPNLTNDQDNSADNLIKKLSIESITPIQFSICGTPATRLNCDSISINYGYSPECNDTLCLLISGRKATLTSDTTNLIKSKLAEKGYNFNDYPYFYTQSDN